jgi:dTDP-4-amino-4,6-dideoxygalactose transaminase
VSNLAEKTRNQISTTSRQFIPFCQHTLGEEEIREVIQVLKSEWLTAGPKTLLFEEAFAQYIGSKCAVAVNSCTAALHVALAAFGVNEGDEVITTPMTFCATAEVIEYQRARPVFVDIDPSSFNIDVNLIEKKITARTRAIIPVHYGGIPCNLDAIYSVAERHSLAVIEDAAHAVGSKYRDKKIGSFGHPTAFSFYPTKNMTTAEGGVITTNDEALAHKMKVLSLHGISRDAWKRYSKQGQWYYEVEHLGYKYNFTDLQAALGIPQLVKLDTFNAQREYYARMYFDLLRGVEGVQLPAWYNDYFNGPSDARFYNSWHLFVIMLNTRVLKIDRGQFIEALKERGVGTSVHFIPLHLQPFYANKYGYKRGDFPFAESIYDRIISLPLYPRLGEQNLRFVVDTIKELLQEHHL